jgi:hypothetical protein
MERRKDGKTESETESKGRRRTPKKEDTVKGTEEKTGPEINRKKINKARIKRNDFICYRFKSIGCCIAS